MKKNKGIRSFLGGPRSWGFVLGAVIMIASLALSLPELPVNAAKGEPPGQGRVACGADGYIAKIGAQGTSPVTYSDPNGKIITYVYIKAGSGRENPNYCSILTQQNSNNGCYAATGLGESSVSVTKVASGKGHYCQDISYVKFYGQEPGLAINLLKSGTWNDIDGDGMVEPGETVSYTFTVTNTGNVTLHSVTVSDVNLGVTVSGGPIATLAPGASDNSTFAGSYTLTQADIDAGKVDNSATVTGKPPSGPDVSDSDNERVSLPHPIPTGAAPTSEVEALIPLTGVTETPTPTATPVTPTPTATQEPALSPTVPPTFAPPQATARVFIPVTGADLSAAQSGSQSATPWASIGGFFAGLALVLAALFRKH